MTTPRLAWSVLAIGSGAPSNDFGDNSNFYLDVDSNDLYRKQAEAWVVVASLGGGGSSFITSVTAPLDVTASDLSLPAATNTDDGYMTAAQVDDLETAVIDVGLANTALSKIVSGQVQIASGDTSATSPAPDGVADDSPVVATVNGGIGGTALTNAITVATAKIASGNLVVALTGDPGANGAVVNVILDGR